MSLCYLCCSSSMSLNLGPHCIDFNSQTIFSVTPFVPLFSHSSKTTYNYHNARVLGQNVPGENVPRHINIGLCFDGLRENYASLNGSLIHAMNPEYMAY